MREKGVLGKDPCRHLVGSRALRKDGHLVLADTVGKLDRSVFTDVRYVEGAVAVGAGEDRLDADVLGPQVAYVEDDLGLEFVSGGKVVGSGRLGLGDDVDILPLAAEVLLPGSDPARKCIVVRHH